MIGSVFRMIRTSRLGATCSWRVTLTLVSPGKPGVTRGGEGTPTRGNHPQSSHVLRTESHPNSSQQESNTRSPRILITDDATQQLLSTRTLIADLGYSSIKQPVGNLETITLKHLCAQTNDQNAGLLLFTGVPKQRSRTDDMKRYFPDYEFTSTSTDGSDTIAAWHTNTWKIKARR